MLLDDGLVSEDFIHSKYFRIYQELRLGVHSVVLESSDDVFPLALPCQHRALHMSSSQGVKRIQLDLDDQSWVEDLKLAEPGKKSTPMADPGFLTTQNIPKSKLRGFSLPAESSWIRSSH
ncbi:hypothetical protein ARMGADRAFT_1011565 [Armillaria gallica]|uniref:Uncharacterized protein n=1 Tax=Armillaria gallica TaxID=47427 RepID=A0A2H3DHE1_ARMGA|nr:hypothetical protein ARMGADRAFT_1011565 [Armillaria gallica]